MNDISPKYQMQIIAQLCDALINTFKSYDDIVIYLEKWIIEIDDYKSNFNIIYDKESHTIDVKQTVATIDGETLLKIAIDLGIATPDFIPSIPMFKNELKSSYNTVAQIFEKAYKNVEKDPSLSIGLANSALESIIKEILNDKRVVIKYNDKETLKKQTDTICKAFCKDFGNKCPSEIKPIISSLINLSHAIEDLRSDKTILHGKTDDSIIVEDPIFAQLIINAVTTVGLFFLNFYKEKYPLTQLNSSDVDSLPF